MTKIGFEQKNKSRNNAGTSFRDDILVPLTGNESDRADMERDKKTWL